MAELLLIDFYLETYHKLSVRYTCMKLLRIIEAERRMCLYNIVVS